MTGSDGRPPVLSIITVSKDIAGEIGDTCESVAGQTWRDFEWIVIDGASRDGTRDRLEQYREHMALFVSEPDRGIYHAMNKGIAAARGEYLLFLNGGDYLASSRALERVFSAERAADVVYGDELHLHPEDGSVEYRKSPRPSALGKLFFAYNVIYHQSAFIRRELFERYGPYNESFAIAGDIEKWVVFAGNGCSFEKIDCGVSVHRLNGISIRPEWAGRLKHECDRIRKTHFSPEELREAAKLDGDLHEYRRVFAWGGSGKRCFFSLEKTGDGRKRKYRVLGVPVLTIRLRRNREAAFLFGVIPLPGGAGIFPPGEGTGEIERSE